MINPRSYQAYQLLHNGILALSHAEQQGFRVDLDYIKKKKVQLTRRMDKLEQDFKQTNFFKHWEHSMGGKANINSPTQLASFLYGVKKLKPPKYTPSGQGSTDEDSLTQLNIPELNLLLERDKLKRLRDVNLDGFSREQVNGYIHPFFNLHLARTYRSSSDHPNFQNIPKRDEQSMQICRGALYPRPGHQLLEIDYSGIEVRVAACYHKDSTMLKYINDPKSDMHRDMAIQIFMLDEYDKSAHNILRQAVKNGFVFPEFYGDYYKKCAINMACNWGKLPQGKWKAGQGIEIGTFLPIFLSDHLISKGIKSLDAFTEHIKKIEQDFWENRFSEYSEWKDRWYNTYKKYGYIDTLTGFRCSGVMGKNDVINYPVQGSAFHCLLWSFTEIDNTQIKSKWDTKLVSQIHDSAILDVNPNERDYITEACYNITTKELPKAWPWIITPMDVEMELCPVDAPWSQKEKYKFK